MKLFQTKYGVFTSFNNDNEINSILSENKIPNFDILEFIKPYISDANLIIDIGSGLGIRSVYYTKINPSVGIYCFEPRENLFCLLTKNLTENNILNTVLMNNMIGHVCGLVRLPIIDKIICDHNDIIQLGNGSIIGSENDPIHFVTLDSLKLLSCNIIFIDLKGFDYLVLLGGLNTIKKFKPIICLKYSKKETEEIFKRLGISNDDCENKSIDLLKKNEYTINELNNEFLLAIPIVKHVKFDQIKINPKLVHIPQDIETNSDINSDYKNSLKSEEVERLVNLGYQFISDV